MKKAARIFAAALALALLCVFFPACEKEPSIEVISEQCVSLFNEALEQYKTADCRSSARATATAAEGDVKASYIQSFESLLHNKAGEKKITSKYFVTDGDPLKVEASAFEPFYDCYIKDGICYFDFGDESVNYKAPFVGDYLSKIGLYAFSDRMPRSVYAVKDRDVIRLDMSFAPEDCAEMEEMFVATMNTVLFQSAPKTEVDRLSLLAYLDAETHRLMNYTVVFGATVPEQPDVALTFTYSEEFSDYGTKEEIVFPDLTAFPEQDLSQVE